MQKGPWHSSARTMKTAPFWTVVAVALVIGAGCERTPPDAHAPTATPPDTVALVDGKRISSQQLQGELARAARGGRVADPNQVLEELIQREQLVARARRLGLDQDPEVQRALDAVLVAKLKERVLEPALRAGTNAAATIISPTPPSPPATPAPQIRLAILRLDATPKTSAEKRARLEARLQEARSRVAALSADTVGFGPLAMEYSDDTASRIHGGDLGWLEADPTKYNLDPEVLKAGFALQNPGDTSAIVPGRDGLYLVRLVGRRTSAEAAAASRPRGGGASEEALLAHRQHLETRKRIESAFLEETRRSIPVILHEDTIARVLAAAAGSNAAPPGVPAPAPAPGPGP